MANDPGTYPFDTVCYITDANGQASGVMISPDCVLTAAHVVIDGKVAVDP